MTWLDSKDHGPSTATEPLEQHGSPEMAARSWASIWDLQTLSRYGDSRGRDRPCGWDPSQQEVASAVEKDIYLPNLLRICVHFLSINPIENPTRLIERTLPGE